MTEDDVKMAAAILVLAFLVVLNTQEMKGWRAIALNYGLVAMLAGIAAWLFACDKGWL